MTSLGAEQQGEYRHNSPKWRRLGQEHIWAKQEFTLGYVKFGMSNRYPCGDVE